MVLWADQSILRRRSGNLCSHVDLMTGVVVLSKY